MRYPILIEPGSAGTAFGVVVPDLPGCFSAGDTLDEAVDAAKEATAAWLDVALDDGRAIPPPSSLEAVSALPEFAGWTMGTVDLDASFTVKVPHPSAKSPTRSDLDDKGPAQKNDD
jgi:predicted RNase H-like HicB family nuclease